MLLVRGRDGDAPIAVVGHQGAARLAPSAADSEPGLIDSAERRAESQSILATPNALPKPAAAGVRPVSEGESRLGGGIRFRDRPERAPSGFIRFEALDEPRRSFRATVTEGSFAFLAPGAEMRCQILELELDGVAYPPDRIPRVEYVFGQHGGVLVEVDAAPQVELALVDRASQLPIRDGRVVYCDFRYDDVMPSRPTAAELLGTSLLSGSDGVVRLRPNWGATAVHVGANGYAWMAITSPAGASMRIRVDLTPAGAAMVRLRGVDDGRAHRVTLNGPVIGGRVALDLRAGASVLVDSLDAGDWRASLGTGETGVPFQVVGGICSDVLVEVPQPVASGVVSVRGMLWMPCEWRRGSLYLDLRSVGASSGGHDAKPLLLACPGFGESVEFVIPNVQVGAYDVHVSDVGVVGRIEVRDGMAVVEVRVPAPATLALSVVDGVSQRLLEGARVEWSPEGSGSLASGMRADYDANGQRYVLRVPAGAKGHFTVEVDDFEAAESPTVAAGAAGETTSERITLVRGGRIEVTISEDGRMVDNCGAEVYKLGSRWPSDSLAGARNGRIVFTSIQTGRWRVVLVESAEYAKQAPVEVDVRAGEVARVQFDLKRR